MCDVRLFRSAWMDFQTAQMIWERPYNDEMILNNAAYHLQQAVEKVIKGALECAGITVPNTHKITKLIQMVSNHGANLVITEWLELLDGSKKEKLRQCLPESKRDCSDFELNCYYLMFKKKL